MAEKSISIDILSEYDVVDNDFCSWEILDPYNESDSDNFSLSDDEEEDPVKPEMTDLSPQEFGSLVVSQLPRSVEFDGVVMPGTEDPSSVFSQLPPHYKQVVGADDVKLKLGEIGDDCAIGGGAVTDDDSDGKYYVDEDDEVENDDLYDDELVAFGLSGKFVKERITKTGKRVAFGRNKTSKKMPHCFNRPGCVRGKRSLGVQHFIV